MSKEKQPLQYHPEVAQEAGDLYREHRETAEALGHTQLLLDDLTVVRDGLADIAKGNIVSRVANRKKRKELELWTPIGTTAEARVADLTGAVSELKTDLANNLQRAQSSYYGDEPGGSGQAAEYYDNAMVEASQAGVPIVTPEVLQEQADAAKALTGPIGQR